MRLYQTDAGQWAGTQSDAKQLGSFVLRDVPTDKQGLLTWLNEHARTAYGAAAGERAAEPAPPISELQETFAHNIKIEDEIAAADLANAIRLASHALSRVQEHLSAAKAVQS